MSGKAKQLLKLINREHKDWMGNILWWLQKCSACCITVFGRECVMAGLPGYSTGDRVVTGCSSKLRAKSSVWALLCTFDKQLSFSQPQHRAYNISKTETNMWYLDYPFGHSALLRQARQMPCGPLIKKISMQQFNTPLLSSRVFLAGRWVCLARRRDPSHQNPHPSHQLNTNYNKLLLMICICTVISLDEPLHQRNVCKCKGRHWFLPNTSSVSTQEADHVIFLFLLGERRGKKSTGRHQNNALNAGYCNWQQSLQNTLGNLLWQGFMCPVPSITMTLFTLP